MRATQATDTSGAPIPGPTALSGGTVVPTIGTFGIANAVYGRYIGNLGFAQGLLDQLDNMLPVVLGRLARKEPRARWGNVGVADVGQHGSIGHYPHTQFVGTSLQAQRNHNGPWLRTHQGHGCLY